MLSRQRLSFISPLKMRRLLIFAIPSLVLLGLLTLTRWRWWRKRSHSSRRLSASQGQTTPLVNSSAVSEDSGVVDAAQALDSRKGSQEHLEAHGKTSRSKPSKELTSKQNWKYPTVSSDINSETYSEVDSLSSSEGIFSGTQHFEVSSFMPSGVAKINKVCVSQSAVCVDSADDQLESAALKKSVSTPTLTINWPNRKRVMVQLPRDLVGRFIGKQGRNIKSLMVEADGAHVYVNQKNLPKDALIVPCTVQGTCEQVEMALKVIATRYPELDLPSQLEKSLSLRQPFPSPLFGTPRLNGESWNTTLNAAQIPASPFKAMVTYIESLSRLWIVPYDKSSELDEQHQSMSYTYCYAVATGNDTIYASESDESLRKKFCAVRVSDIHWLRGQIAKLNDDGGNYEVLLVDYGSTVIVPHTSIRPLRREHTELPIQAFPCELANVIPNDAMSEEGLVSLQALVEGMVLEVHITGQTTQPLSPTGQPISPDTKDATNEDTAPTEQSNLLKWFHIEPAPLVELYTRYGSDSPLFINRELVDRCYAVWREGPLASET